MGFEIMNIIVLIVVFCVCKDVTHKAERKWSAATCQGLKKRGVRTWLLGCMAYVFSKRSRYSNRAVTTLKLVIEYSIT